MKHGINASPDFSIYDVTVMASGLDHPECVAFGPDGAAYAGGEEGQVYRWSPGAEPSIVANVQGGINGICLDARSNIYACNYGLAELDLVTVDGAVRSIWSGAPDQPAKEPNFAAFDPRGNLFFSDSGGFSAPSGWIYRTSRDGGTVPAFGGHLHFPNGIAFDANGDLLVVQSSASNILRFPVRDQTLGAPEIYARLPGTVPDGIAVAASGNVYVACYVPDAILRVNRNRTVDVVLEDPAAEAVNRPTNVAFQPNSKWLWFSNFGGHTINAIDIDEKGLPLTYAEPIRLEARMAAP